MEEDQTFIRDWGRGIDGGTVLTLEKSGRHSTERCLHFSVLGIDWLEHNSTPHSRQVPCQIQAVRVQQSREPKAGRTRDG